jgi:hypothetical protein
VSCQSYKWGQREYLCQHHGNDLATFTDANNEHFLAHVALFPFISFFLIGFWFGKRRPTTALYYDGSEITALFHGAFKTIQLHSCDSSIGSPLTSPVHTFEDNQGTIKLIHLKVACTKTSIMLLTALQSLLIVPN